MPGISSAIHLRATPSLLKLREKCFFRFSFVMTQPILSVAIPPGHLSGICHVTWSRRWGIVRKPQPGVGHLSILLDAANVVLFSIVHLKKYVYLNNFKEVKRYMWFSLHHFPIPQYFFASVCFPPSSSVRIWRKNNKCIVRRVKGKDAFFVREWLSQKGLEKLCKIFES